MLARAISPLFLAATVLACSTSRSAGSPPGETDAPNETSLSDATATETQDDSFVIDGISPSDDVPPNPDCPTADYYVSVESPSGTRELRHMCGANSFMNDTPSMFLYHSHTDSDVIAACSSHTSGEPPDFSFLNISDVHSTPPHWELDWYQGDITHLSNGRAPTVTITRMDPIGGIVEGSYAGDVAQTLPDGSPGEFIHIQGTFRVCHIKDFSGA